MKCVKRHVTVGHGETEAHCETHNCSYSDREGSEGLCRVAKLAEANESYLRQAQDAQRRFYELGEDKDARIEELEGILRQVREQIDSCKVPSEGQAHDLHTLRKAIQHIDYITSQKPVES